MYKRASIKYRFSDYVAASMNHRPRIRSYQALNDFQTRLMLFI